MSPLTTSTTRTAWSLSLIWHCIFVVKQQTRQSGDAGVPLHSVHVHLFFSNMNIIMWKLSLMFAANHTRVHAWAVCIHIHTANHYAPACTHVGWTPQDYMYYSLIPFDPNRSQLHHHLIKTWILYHLHVLKMYKHKISFKRITVLSLRY